MLVSQISGTPEEKESNNTTQRHRVVDRVWRWSSLPCRTQRRVADLIGDTTAVVARRGVRCFGCEFLTRKRWYQGRRLCARWRLLAIVVQCICSVSIVLLTLFCFGISPHMYVQCRFVLCVFPTPIPPGFMNVSCQSRFMNILDGLACTDGKPDSRSDVNGGLLLQSISDNILVQSPQI